MLKIKTVRGTQSNKVASRKEWLAARLRLLKAEKDLTRRSDELARRRQGIALGSELYLGSSRCARPLPHGFSAMSLIPFAPFVSDHPRLDGKPRPRRGS